MPTPAAQLFFILSYLKTNNLQSVQGALFGLTQPDVNVWVHLLQPLLQQTLATLQVLPARQMSALALTPTGTQRVFQDGTERPMPRPTDPVAQTLYDSGKRKQHTVKNNVLMDALCWIHFRTPTTAGKKHDKKLADESGYQLPRGSWLGQATGFQGFTVESVAILQPKKKPRGQALGDWERSYNQWVSSLRMRMEHAIGGVKRYRIVKDKIRNWKDGFRDAVLETCCGLHNFRLRFRPWHYDPIQLHLLAPV